MKRFAEENPELTDQAPLKAPKEPAPPPMRAAPPPVRRPVGTGRPASPSPARTPQIPNRSPDQDENGKTTKPGLPNSMNKQELDAFLRKNKLKAS
jgi:hypothetical protein